MKIPASISAIAILAACSPTSMQESTSGLAEGAEACAAMQGGRHGASSRWVGAVDGLPAFCEVTATLEPVDGSSIGVVYRFPENWNGKVLGLGGGGWAGNVTLAAASDGLGKRFATMQTDGGHPGTSVWENDWVNQPEAATDFAWRAVHEMTVTGKGMARRYYQRDHDRAYFQGCSTGGRMALMEAQRFPDDYDAIVAGAPVYTLQVQTSAVLRSQTFASANGSAAFSPADLSLVQRSVLRACDADDGLEDGIINNPAACRWQPRQIQCSGAKNATCLAPQQVTALTQAYQGIRASDGSWSMHPMRRGGEESWAMFVGVGGQGTSADPTRGGGLLGLERVIFAGQPVDWDAFSDADYQTIRASDFARMYEAKDPDLSAFFERGGKLMLWHGESDPGPSPVLSTDYARQVIDGNAQATDQFRYFRLPGVGHCRGGPGADQVDLLAAMDSWVDTQSPPERLIGTNADSGITRPHCAWPNVAVYDGQGSANDPQTWQCQPGALE